MLWHARAKPSSGTPGAPSPPGEKNLPGQGHSRRETGPQRRRRFDPLPGTEVFRQGRCMAPGRWHALITRYLGLLLTVIAFVATPASAVAQAPGGFVELATGVDVRPTLTPAQIQALLPARGAFTFPPPYLTHGLRLTNETDCIGGTDCVDYVGYSYWRNINNHAGSNTMLIFVGLDMNAGGGGPTLFSVDKTTDEVTKVGPLFDAGSPFAWATGEGWYFSATRPTTLYVNEGSRLLRYDVVTRTFETVLDVSTLPGLFGTNRMIWQMHSSNDDRVHSATVKDASTFADLGCFAYREDIRQFFYFPQKGLLYDECQVDRSEEHTSELQSPCNLVCRLLLEKKKQITTQTTRIKKKTKKKQE